MIEFTRSRRRVSIAGIVFLGLLLAVPVHAQSDSPVAASRFGISVDGVQIGVFSQLTSEAATGAGPQFITLAGGRTQGIEMAAWHELVILGDVAAARKNATIVMYNGSGRPVKTYHLVNAWPAKMSLDGTRGGQLTTSTVMLIYETLRVQQD
jgi:T4-like virus tail tube protein gp19